MTLKAIIFLGVLAAFLFSCSKSNPTDTDLSLSSNASATSSITVSSSSDVVESGELPLWRTGDDVTKLRIGGYGYGINEDAQRSFDGTTFTCGSSTWGGEGVNYSFQPYDMPRCTDVYGNIQMGFHIVSNMDPASAGEVKPWYFGFGMIQYDLLGEDPENSGQKLTFDAGSYTGIFVNAAQTGCDEGVFSIVLNTTNNEGANAFEVELESGENTVYFDHFNSGSGIVQTELESFQSVAIKCKLEEESEKDVIITIKKLSFIGGVE